MKLINKFSQKGYLAVAILISAVVLISCKDDLEGLDPGDILPEDDLLIVVDTILPIEIFTIAPNDTLYTNSQGACPIGVVNDPQLGVLKTELVTNYIYSSPIDLFHDSISDVRVISLEIELGYRNEYGNREQIDFDIYELEEDVPKYSYSDYIMYPHMYSLVSIFDSYRWKNESDAEDAVYPGSGQSKTYVNVDTLIVTLTDEFAQKFIDSSLPDNIYDVDNPEVFRDYFKGFYFKCEAPASPGGGIIISEFWASRMVLVTEVYDRRIEIDTANGIFSKWDTLNNVFELGAGSTYDYSESRSLNIYDNIFRTEVEEAIGDTMNSQETIYLQSLRGPRAYIKIPALDELRNGLDVAVSVNQAELLLPYDSEDYDYYKDIYKAPSKLALYQSTTYTPVIDDGSLAYPYDNLGGLDTANNRFRLNIPNHVHEFLRDPESDLSTSFFLFPGTSTPASIETIRPRRAVLNGINSDNPPSIRIIYTKIPN